MDISNNCKNVQKITQARILEEYFVEKFENDSKGIDVNVLGRCSTCFCEKKLKLCNFLERFYLTSMKIGFLCVKLRSILNKKAKNFILILEKLENIYKFTFLLYLINSLSKQTELIRKSEKLEKILKSRKIKKLTNSKSEHLAKLSLKLIKGIISSSTYRLTFSTFIKLKSYSHQAQTKKCQKIPKLLCLSTRNHIYKSLSKIFNLLYLYSISKKSKLLKLANLTNLFLISLGKVYEILKYFKRTPKYFLSSNLKYRNLYHNSIKFPKPLKISEILVLTNFISKKITFLKSYSFFKLFLPQSSYSFSFSIYPTKLNLSNDSLFMNTTIKNKKLKDFLPSDRNKNDQSHIKFSLVFLIDLIQLKVNEKCSFVFCMIKKIPKYKINQSRISCRDLPVCRKLNCPSLRNFFIKENTFRSISPIGRKSNKK